MSTRLFALVDPDTLQIQGVYNSELARNGTEPLVSAPVHPELHLNAITAVRTSQGIAIVAERGVPTLEELKEVVLRRLDDETRDYILSRYSQERQTSLIAFAVFAIAQGMNNRLMKVGEVMAWIETVLTYHYSKSQAVNAATTIEELEAVVWDFNTLTASDPDVWLAHVIAITD
jgi:hypothetical protein